MNNFGVDEEGEDQFFESFDRLVSNSSSSSSDNDEGDCRRSALPCPDYVPPSTSDSISSMEVSMYHVWITEPGSVEERRSRLLNQMGFSANRTLSRLNFNDSYGVVDGEIKRSFSYDDHLRGVGGADETAAASSINRSRSDSDSIADPESPSLCSKNHCNCSGSPLISSVQLSGPQETTITREYNERARALPLKHSSSGELPENYTPSVGGVSGTMGEEINADSSIRPDVPIIDNDSDRIVENGRLCTIKDLDNGKEFVVNELGEDGTWKKFREVGTGRQLTREEFELCVGHSPIVQELMRRQKDEESEGSKEDMDHRRNSIVARSKKKGGWLRSIKNVASSMAGQRERRSSDDRDTSSEKGRRSSSATDDSQDILFQVPQRTKVRQYGKSCKELTALYMNQEIQAHNGSIWTLKFSSDGLYLATAGEDCVIHIWQVVESKRFGDFFTEKTEDGNSNGIFPVNCSPERALRASNGENHFEKRRRKVSYNRKSTSLDYIQVPDSMFALSDKPFCTFEGHREDVLDLSWSKSQFQYLLSSSMDKTVRLWDIFSNSCLKVFSHSDYVTCIQFNPVNDDYFISGSLDAKVRIWSIRDHQVVDWNDLHEMVTAACYTPDGQGALVGTHKGSCYLYNLSDNKLLQRSRINLQNKKNKSRMKKITGFQFSPGSSSEVFVTSADSQIRVVDGVDLVRRFKGFHNTNSQISASLTANGKYVVCASEDSHVYVWRDEHDFRSSISKGLTTIRSYEHFFCSDVLVAIPWPCISIGRQETESIEHRCTYAAAINHVQEDESNKQKGSPSMYQHLNNRMEIPKHVSNDNIHFSDRVSATWPEEKLVASRSTCNPSSNKDLCNDRLAWGLVIVTAGLGGKIKTFQNFGLPVQV